MIRRRRRVGTPRKRNADATRAKILQAAIGEFGERGLAAAKTDDIAERCRPGVRVTLRCRVRKDEFVVSTPALSFWRPRSLTRRFERAFGRRLVVRHGTG